MQLTFWHIIAIFGAGAAMVALGAIIAGVLVYKTKYAGQSMFHGEHVPKGDAFNIDDGFLDEPLNVGAPESKELPPEVEAANAEFLKQFNVERMVKEAENHVETEESL